jgi:hypothetical protein
VPPLLLLGSSIHGRRRRVTPPVCGFPTAPGPPGCRSCQRGAASAGAEGSAGSAGGDPGGAPAASEASAGGGPCGAPARPLAQCAGLAFCATGFPVFVLILRIMEKLCGNSV